VDKLYLALQEGTCDITPFSLLPCLVCSDRLTWRKGEFSAVGRNRPFFHILKSKGTIFGPFSRQSASSEWIKGSATSQIGSRHTFPPVRPIRVTRSPTSWRMALTRFRSSLGSKGFCPILIFMARKPRSTNVLAVSSVVSRRRKRRNEA
jgi:hypothetical protein